MITDVILFIVFLLGFILLIYSTIILIKRKEYENKRILSGYNVMIFSIFLLALSCLVKGLKFIFLGLKPEFLDLSGSLVYFDVITNIFLIPLFVISLIVSLLLFKEV